MERRQARRRPLWCRRGRRFLWRIDVSSRDRRVQDRARGVGGTFARTQIRVAGHAVADAAPATIWRHGNFPKPLPPPLAESGGIAARISVRCYVVATGRWLVLLSAIF